MRVLISCEHAANHVPPAYADLFRDKEELLASHAAYDLGAAQLARDLATQLSAPCHLGETTRLLVDLNRAADNRRGLFSAQTKTLPAATRQELLRRHHTPYRQAVEDTISRLLTEHAALLHLSIHSFTPVLRGKTRKADIALLYDPNRPAELEFCRTLGSCLRNLSIKPRIRMNYPYRGTSDGMTKHLRKKFAGQHYLGVEIELNQGLLNGEQTFLRSLQQGLGNCLKSLVNTEYT